ncbi:MAG: DUF6980 family protein [Rickettsiales bacterium]
MEHCCNNMEYYVSENREISYDLELRRYVLRLANAKNATCQLLFYCPWCGTKLPTSLADKWFEILKVEYGLTDPIFDDAEKIPKEFKTDEWWKKRGL